MQTLYIHPKNPQDRLLTTVIDALAKGSLVILPTDNGYRFAFGLTAKNAFDRLTRLGGRTDDLCLLCADISQMAHYAKISDEVFLTLKRTLSPRHGFMLEPTKALGKRITDKPLCFSVSDTPVITAILSALDEPLFVMPLICQGETITEHFDIIDKLDAHADLLVDVGTLDSTDLDIVSFE